MFYLVPGYSEGHIGVIEIILIVAGVIMIGILLVWCCIVIRLHFLQQNLPNGQDLGMGLVFVNPTPPPHPIVYSTTPVSSVPALTQPGYDGSDGEPTSTTATSLSRHPQHAAPVQGAPICYPAYQMGMQPYPPHIVVQAPVNLTPKPTLFPRFIF
uniref:Protein shisa-5 n=1 Tax=Haemonchus contortus TaxID=6289 RepID=A0A7I4Y514_HAECO